MTILEPMQGSVLAELATSEFGDIPVPEKQHDSTTWAKVMAVNENDKEYLYLLDRTIFYRKYKDDARIPSVIEDKKKLVFIDIKDILGTAYEGSASTN